MIEFTRQVLTNQFDAALCMMNQCIAACRPAHWEGRIANDTFRYVAYHTLFFADLYLSRSEESFVLCDIHKKGGDEREPVQSVGLDKPDTLTYLLVCRQKMIETIAAETSESLQGPSGFSYRKFSRGELHLYNLRHIQHHTGQLSAYLRRVDPMLQDMKALPWVGSGWK